MKYKYNGRVILSGNSRALSIISMVLSTAYEWKNAGYEDMNRWERVKFAAKNPNKATWLGLGRKVANEIGEELEKGNIIWLIDYNNKHKKDNKLTIEIGHNNLDRFNELIKQSKGWSNLNKFAVRCKVEKDFEEKKEE